MDTKNNPADDITRGKNLLELSQKHRWSQGPPFLLLNSNCWPANPCMPHESEPVEELRKTMFCGTAMSDIINLPDPKKYSNWNDLIKETKNTLYGAADHNSNAAQCYISSERHLLQRAQSECFPEECNALKADEAIPKSSKLLPLSPEYDSDTGLIRVGGRLRRVETLDYENIHPIVLNPRHPLTQLIIKHYDEKLLHPGSERVLGEMRRRYWILHGRQAIRQHQHQCRHCQRWRANPVIPKMADLPPARLRLSKPAFWSTGMDCFGPFTVKVGRCSEKRWGMIFKCLTTRCIHIELLDSMGCRYLS